MRTIDWAGDHLVAIDQTLLPGQLTTVELRSVDAVVDALQRLVVRGAPAIGVCGALGVAMAAQLHDRSGAGTDALMADAARLRAARPTAVNLAWGVDRVMAESVNGVAAMVATAVAMLDEDIEINRTLAHRGADLVGALCGVRAVRVHTHCNAGGLACVEWGTALGVVRALHERGLVERVYADETRPLLQGSRLTAWELVQMGIDTTVVVDSAAASVISRGLVDVVVVGADRIAANGDVANKIGTYPLALAAARAGVPFLVAAPESTVDLRTASGAEIDIEMRSADEVLSWGGVRAGADGAEGLNPAFDVTPADLVTAVITERRVVRPALGQTMER